MTTRLNITLLCCLCLIAWGCNTSRHSSLNTQCYVVADSNNVSIQKHLVSSLTSDSLNLEVIEITTPATDSLNGLTVKIARLSRSIDRMVTASASSISSTTKTRQHSSQKIETANTEVRSAIHLPIMLFLAISLAVFFIYLFIKK